MPQPTALVLCAAVMGICGGLTWRFAGQALAELPSEAPARRIFVIKLFRFFAGTVAVLSFIMAGVLHFTLNG